MFKHIMTDIEKLDNLLIEASNLASILAGMTEGPAGDPNRIYEPDYSPADGDVYVARAANLLVDLSLLARTRINDLSEEVAGLNTLYASYRRDISDLGPALDYMQSKPQRERFNLLLGDRLTPVIAREFVRLAKEESIRAEQLRRAEADPAPLYEHSKGDPIPRPEHYKPVEVFYTIHTDKPVEETVYTSCRGINCTKTSKPGDETPHSPECEAEHSAVSAGGVFLKITPILLKEARDAALQMRNQYLHGGDHEGADRLQQFLDAVRLCSFSYMRP